MKKLFQRYSELEKTLDNGILHGDFSSEAATLRHSKESRIVLQQQMAIREAIDKARISLAAIVSDGLEDLSVLITAGDALSAADLNRVLQRIVSSLFQPEGFDLEEFRTEFKILQKKSSSGIKASEYVIRLAEIESETLAFLEEYCTRYRIANPC